MEGTTVQLLRFSLALLSFCVHSCVGGFSSGGYPGYYEVGLPMQDDVKPRSSSWYGQGDVSDPIRPLRSKNITYNAAVKGVFSSLSHGPQTGSYGSGPVTSIYNLASESDARRQTQGSLISSAGSGNFDSGSLAAGLNTGVNSESKPVQLNYQTLVQTGNESVASSNQQPVQTGSLSSGQQLASAQSFFKPQRSRPQVVSMLFSGGRPILTSSFGKPSVQASYQSVAQLGVQPSYQSGSHPSDRKPAQASYQSVAHLSSQQPAQASYLSVAHPSDQQPAQAHYQFVSQPSVQRGLAPSQPSSLQSTQTGYQSAQACYQSVPQSSGQPGQARYHAPSQPGSLRSPQAGYQPVPWPSSQKPGLTRYRPVSQPSGLQSAEPRYQSVPWPSSQKPGLTRYRPVSQPSGLQLAQPRYQSVPQSSGQPGQARYHAPSQPGSLRSPQAGYWSVPQPSGQSLSSYESLSSFGSQPQEQPSNVQLASSYESVLQPDIQDTAPLRSQTTQDKRFSPGVWRLLQQVKS